MTFKEVTFLLNHIGDYYKVLLPDWVFVTALSEEDVMHPFVKTQIDNI